MNKSINLPFIKNTFIAFIFCSLTIYAIVFSGYAVTPFTTLLLCLISVSLLLKPINVPRNMFISGTIFFVIMILSTVFSISFRRSIEQLWILLTAVTIIIYLGNLKFISKRQNEFLISILSVGLFWMILSWRDTLSWYINWRSTTITNSLIPDIPFRLNGGNTIAAFYAILFFICIVLFIKTHKNTIKIILGFYLLSVSILIFLSSSRGAWVGMIIGIICLILVEAKPIGLFFKEIKEKKWLLWTFGSITLIGIGAILFLYIKILGNHPNHVPGLGVRAPFWVPAWKGFLESPLIGNGLYTGGTFFILANSIPWQEIYLHAHNTYLDILRDTGISGLLSFAVLFFSVFQFIHVKYKNKKNAFDLIALCSMGSFFGHSIVDGNYLMPFAAVSLTLLLGLSLNSDEHDLLVLKVPFWIKLSIISLVIVGAGYFTWNRSILTKAIDRFKHGDVEMTYQLLEKSSKLDPLNPVVHIYHGLLAATVSQTIEGLDLIKSINAFEMAISLDPNWAVSHANLGALYFKDGEIEKAKAQFEQASKLSPNWYVPNLNLGMIYEMEEDEENSSSYYIKTLSLQAELAQSSYWKINEFRQTIVNSWLETNQQPTYSFSDFDQISKQPFSLPMIKLGFSIVEEDLEKAESLLEKSKLTEARYPFIAAERLWLAAEIQYYKNNLNEAFQLADQAIESTKKEGIYGPGSAGSSLYYDGLYRAPVLPLDFVPQLMTIPLSGDWENRYYNLAKWYQLNDEEKNCLAMVEDLVLLVPEYFTYNNPKSPCGTP